MGNQHSSSNSEGGIGGLRPPRVPFRSGGALGLSKAELDKRCKASGLYDSCQWENKAIRRLVGDGKIAARLKGSEDRDSDSSIECPICFLHYSQINMTKCCSAYVCSECYLQVRPQNQKSAACPFCNAPKLSVHVAKTTKAELAARDLEEQKVLEARVQAERRIKAEQCQETALPLDKSNEGEHRNEKVLRNRSDSNGGFGSFLEQDDRVAAVMRKRSESVASSDASVGGNDDSLIQSIAMSAEDRRSLESQMRAQHNHPLTLRLQAEATERRMENERNYYTTPQGQQATIRNSLHRNRRLLRGSGGRDWFTIVDNFERSGGRPIQSIDDLMVLEAAIVLSMEEEQRRGGSPENFDAARHAREGFPLVRAASGGGSIREDRLQQLARALNTPGSTTNTIGNISSSSGSSSSSRRSRGSSRHSPFMSLGRGAPSNASATLDTASLLLGGISEEQQMAMAIAASLQESQPSSNADNSDSSGDSSENATTETTNQQAADDDNNQAEDPPEIVEGVSAENGESRSSEALINEDGEESAPDIPAVEGEIVASPGLGDSDAVVVQPEADENANGQSDDETEETSSSPEGTVILADSNAGSKLASLLPAEDEDTPDLAVISNDDSNN